MHRLLPTISVLACAALLASACSGGGDDDSLARERPTTSQPSSTTTTQVGGAPLTALTVDHELLSRPALVVKLDNAPRGRPQEGLNQADVIVEEEVEGGITRLAAIFHSDPPPEVGPVRSARSTDIVLLAPLGRTLFVYSGTNAAFQAQIEQAQLVQLTPGSAGAAYYRKSGRPGLYDLWARVDALFRAAPADLKPPPRIFSFRSPAEKPAGEPAGGVAMEWRDKVVTTALWEWDAAAGVYVRTQNGTPHVDAAGTRVRATNVIVQLTEYENTPFVDQSGAPVPEAKLVGEGGVLVLTGGNVIRGRWRRAAPEEPTSYVDLSGNPIRLKPGNTWIELVRPGMAALR